jgi:hypothetical protein
MQMDSEMKELLGRVVDPLDEMPDVVSAVLVRGARSVRRRRAAGAVVGTAASVGMVAGTVALATGQAPSSGGFTPAASGGLAQPTAGSNRASASATPTGAPAPQSRPTRGPRDGKTEVMANGKPVPAALKQFHLKAAGVLDTVLPARFGTVTALQSTVHGYRVTAGGSTYAITFRVDAVAKATPATCGRPDPKGPTCVQRTLPNGSTATASRLLTGIAGGKNVLLPELRTAVPGHEVALYLFADESNGSLPPISSTELLDLAANPRFTALVDEWAAQPTWTGWETSASATPMSSTPPSR